MIRVIHEWYNRCSQQLPSFILDPSLHRWSSLISCPMFLINLWRSLNQSCSLRVKRLADSDVIRFTDALGVVFLSSQLFDWWHTTSVDHWTLSWRGLIFYRCQLVSWISAYLTTVYSGGQSRLLFHCQFIGCASQNVFSSYWRSWCTEFFTATLQNTSDSSLGCPTCRVDHHSVLYHPTIFSSRQFVARLLVQGRFRWPGQLFGTVCQIARWHYVDWQSASFSSSS